MEAPIKKQMKLSLIDHLINQFGIRHVDLAKEVELIKQKKSNLSSNQRKAVLTVDALRTEVFRNK